MKTSAIENLKLTVIKKVIDLEDEVFLQKLKEILDEPSDYKLTDTQKNILEERSMKYDKGKSQTLLWKVVKDKARKSLKH